MFKSNLGESDNEEDDPNKMVKRIEQIDRDNAVTTAAEGSRAMLRMLTTTAGGVGDKKGMSRSRSSIGRKTTELNLNRTLDQDQYQA